MARNRVKQESKVVLKLLPANLVSLKVYLWTLPVSIFVAVLMIPSQIDSVQQLVSWVTIGFLSHLGMLPFVLYLREKKNIAEHFILVLLMGIVRGGLIGLLAPLFDVTDPLHIYLRTLNSMIAVFYWFQIGSIVYEFQVIFRRKIKALLEESILKEVNLESQLDRVDSSELIVLISDLQKKITKTITGTPTVESLQARAHEIDKLMKKYIRPLSKSQWRDGELVWVSTGFFRVIAGTLRVAPLHIWAVSALTLPFSLIGQFTRYGFVQSIVMQSVWLLLVLLSQLTVERTVKATNGNYLPQNLSLIGAIAFVVSPALLVLQMNWPQNSYTLTNSLITHTSSMISIISFMCASSLVLALHEDRSQVFKALGDALKEKDLQLLVRSGRQAHSDADYAQYLHVEVQSQLLACKLLLLKAAESEFTLFEPEVTKQIIDRFEKIKQPYESPAARIPSMRVDELEKSWAGIAEISSELSPELGTLHSYSDVLSQLIEESVVNSIRHGKAQKIHIRSFPTPGLINVVITDNGQLKEGNTGSGLGTLLFDTFAKSWTIGREGDETVVKFSIATDA
jgi:hypothetical protein